VKRRCARKLGAAPALMHQADLSSVGADDKGVSVGKAEVATKGEDVSALHATHGRYCFGVFDGHGGVQAAKLCAAELLPKLGQLSASDAHGHAAFPTDPLVNEFWAMDASLGDRHVFAGTTASVLLVSPVAKADGAAASLGCTLCWVGDSRVVRVDMTAAASEESLVSTTPIHTPGTAEEQARLEGEWKVRGELSKGAEGEPYPPAQPSPEAVAAAAQTVGLALDGQELRLMVRALERERLIEAVDRSKGLRRGQSSLGKRLDAKGAPTVIKASRGGNPEAEGSAAPASAAQVVSTVVTRSIGDWDGARAMIPEPGLERFQVEGTGKHERVVIASDGLWDFCTPELAAKIARRERTAQAAASALLRLANNRSIAKFNELKDDTTCVVVDLNPSHLPFEKPKMDGACSACCVVS